MNKVAIVAALILGVPAVCAGQGPVAPPRLEVDRSELMGLLAHYEALDRSTAYSEGLRQEVRQQSEFIRERLRTGDFRAGDRLALTIQGGLTVLQDTLTVQAGSVVEVPTLGPISLQGVLRSELEGHLTTEVGRFLQSPKVEARALVRVSVAGGVGRPGFYTFPTDLRLSDVAALAGGPGTGADPGRIQILRGGEVVYSVQDLLVPVAEGRTLDEVGMQAGDRIELPVAIGAAAQAGAAGAQSPVGQLITRTLNWVVIPLLLGPIYRRR